MIAYRSQAFPLKQLYSKKLLPDREACYMPSSKCMLLYTRYSEVHKTIPKGLFVKQIIKVPPQTSHH